MTDPEWLACNDPSDIVAHVPRHPTTTASYDVSGILYANHNSSDICDLSIGEVE